MTVTTSTSSGPPPARPGRPWTVRVAAWSSRHRWIVALLWFVLTIGLFVSSILAGGTKAVEAVSRDQGAKYELIEANQIFGDANANAGPQAPASQSVIVLVSNPAGTITDPAAAAAVKDVVSRLTALQATVDGTAGPVFEQLVDPSTAPPQAGLISPDQSTVRIVGQVPGDGKALTDRLQPLPATLDELRAAHPGLAIHAVSNALANGEIAELINSGLDRSLLLTLPITFAILLIAFGAVVAALVPLVLAVTSLLGAFGVLALYSQSVAPVSPYASQLVVLIGLAVAVDYSLFMVTRFRTERRHRAGVPPRSPTTKAVYTRRTILGAVGIVPLAVGLIAGSNLFLGIGILADLILVPWAVWRLHERGSSPTKLSSIEASSATAGRAVFFSGLAVTISIGGLFLLDDPLFRSMAVGTIAVVLISVVGSLTFLPATLAILGDGVNGGRIPFLGRERPEGSGVWATIVRAVMRRPVISFLVSGSLLVVLALPVIRLHLGTGDLASFPDSLDSVQAINLLNAKYPTGVGLDFNVVVTHADEQATKDAVARLGPAIAAIPGIGGPADVVMAADGKTASVNFKMPGDPNDQRNQDIVRQVRSSVIPTVFAGAAGARALVTGDAAYTLDVANFYLKGMPQVIAFVLTLSFLLLLVAFRSIVIPIKAILLNLLSTGAAIGLMVVVFQEGWLQDALGFKPGPIESFVPVFIFTILFGLSMDYHVFILTRIKEARDHGMSSNEAVARGIAITAGTITSAAAIMVCVFAVFLTLPLTVIKQLGFGLAVAVLIDATIVRSILLPATMRLLGEWNWWLPRWLGWLPHVTIEAEVDEDEAEGTAVDGGQPEVRRRAADPTA